MAQGWDKYVEGDVDANGDEITKSDLSACYRGYGCGIQELRMAPGSIASDREILPTILPDNPEEMRMKQTAYSDANWPVKQMFQTSNVPFLVGRPSVSSYTAWDPDTDQFKVMDWSSQGADCIDIPKDVLLHACNANDVDSANQLLDIALALEAVQFVCFANEFRSRDGSRSKYTGSPVISASKMMKSVVVADLVDSALNRDGQSVRFSTGKSLGDGSDAIPITLSVCPLPGAATGTVAQHNPELPIVCKVCTCLPPLIDESAHACCIVQLV